MPKVFKALYRLALRYLPANRAIDNCIAFLSFLRAHRRLPTDKPLFNDVAYKIATTDEILDPLRVFVTDKEFLKIFVKGTVGDRYNVPTIKVLHSMDDARRYPFPPDCCIKPTHMSGRIIRRRGNEPIDLAEIALWLRSNFYHVHREANYRTLRPKVIVEPLIFGGEDLFEYRIFCHAGRPGLIMVDAGMFKEHTKTFFDTDWNGLPFTLRIPRATRPVERPRNLAEMLAVAGSLGSHFGFVRIDLYSNGEECLVGEITNFHANALRKFTPASGEELASRLIFGKS